MCRPSGLRGRKAVDMNPLTHPVDGTPKRPPTIIPHMGSAPPTAGPVGAATVNGAGWLGLVGGSVSRQAPPPRRRRAERSASEPKHGSAPTSRR